MTPLGVLRCYQAHDYTLLGVLASRARAIPEHEVPVGTTGEIVVRTPTIMKGYYRDPEATAAAFRNGFFLTGDLGWMDADGYLWFVARKKDVIRRRGENISGAEIDLVAGGSSRGR